MLKNIFKIAFRNLVKDKFYSFLNIFGLSVGISASFLITLYVVDEVSYDKFFKDSERIHRVVTIGNFGDDNLMRIAASSAPLAGGFKNDIPEVEAVTRIQPTVLTITKEGEIFKENHVFFADSTFFDIFQHEFISGDPDKVLIDPNSIVITKETAIKYFGEEAFENGNVIGQMLKAGDQEYAITGILENVPENTHLNFDILVSMATNQDALNPVWISMNYFTYLKLREGVDAASLEDKLRSMVIQYVVPQVIAYMNFPAENLTEDKVDQNFKFVLQPLLDIHLKSNLYAEFADNGNIQYIYIFLAIAAFIIIIACINFMNLSTARSAKRAKEVGIRKTLGSASGKIAGQFMMESFIYVILAVVLALGLTEAFRGPFNLIANKSLSFNIFSNPWILYMILAFTVIIGSLAGAYPAFFLTKFKPVDVLKGSIASGAKNSGFRSILVVLQFMISIGLIVCTLLVYKQMNFIQNVNLGFDKENVIILGNANNLGPQGESFKQELINRGEIKSASFTTHIPSNTYWSSAYKAEGENETDHILYYQFSDFDYQETIGFEMKQGRYFSMEFLSDSSAVIINEAAAHTFGFAGNDYADAIGKILETISFDGARDRVNIIGVIKDYNFQSLHSTVAGMAIRQGSFGDKLVVKVNPGNHQETLAIIEDLWKTNLPMVPFEYTFLDEEYGRMFAKEERMSKIFTVFAILAIMIACLGLFGLAAYTSEQRTKEIGIRKAMGANAKNVIGMLTREFTKLVIIAFALSVPVSWYIMKQWFSGFAYKTSMGVWPFIIAGALALLIAWLTVSYQSVKAAVANPVKSLRDE